MTLKEKTNKIISNHSVSHPFPKDSYINQPSESFIHLIHNPRGIIYEILDGIQVIEGDQQNVPGPGAQQHLVFESHCHQVIQLQGNTGKCWLCHNRESVTPLRERCADVGRDLDIDVSACLWEEEPFQLCVLRK